MAPRFRVLVGVSLIASSLGCENKKPDAAHPPSSTISVPGSESTASTELPAFDPAQLNPFAPLPEAVETPAVDETVKLGRFLYFDLRLSQGGKIACASCHDLGGAGADGRGRSTGARGEQTRRNTPTVLNVGGSFAQGWDGRASTVEDFVSTHLLESPILGLSEEKRLIDTVQSIPAYAAGFKKAFPEEKPSVTVETIGRALGAYVKKLFARSRWDKYLAGDRTAVTDAELAGLAMFVEAGCPSCHQGKYLGGTQAQKLGIAKPWPTAGADLGRFEFSKQEIDRGMFKVPTLRNVARTALICMTAPSPRSTRSHASWRDTKSAVSCPSCRSRRSVSFSGRSTATRPRSSPPLPPFRRAARELPSPSRTARFGRPPASSPEAPLPTVVSSARKGSRRYPAPMKRLTISGEACLETLALLITMAWADGRLEDHERDGVRAAASVFNLTKELRDRLDQLLETPIAVEELLFDELSARDKAFAYVAAAWLSGVDENVDTKEEELLDKLGSMLEFTKARRQDLARIARDLEPLRKGGKSWTSEVATLFKAIPARLEGDGSEAYEVAFE